MRGRGSRGFALAVALGGSALALPDAASLVLPVLLVAVGLLLLTRRRE